MKKMLLTIFLFHFAVKAESDSFLFREAILQGNANEIIFLCHSGININLLDDIDGFSALHFAVYSGKKDMVKLIMQLGADPNLRVEPLEKHEFKMPDISFRYLGATPVYIAAALGLEEIVEILLSDNRTDSRIEEYYGYSPSSAAEYYRFPRIVQLINDRKATIGR